VLGVESVFVVVVVGTAGLVMEKSLVSGTKVTLTAAPSSNTSPTLHHENPHTNKNRMSQKKTKTLKKFSNGMKKLLYM
jgi:hypothetical protein